MGLITQITILLEEVCLGNFYFETAVLLRDTIFINGILTNIEVAYGLTVENIKSLEILDRILLRKILGSHAKSPSCSLHLELGCLSLKFVIISRRLNFLHYILNRPDGDLLKNFFEVQNKNPVKNDWVLTIKEDIDSLKINLNLEQIKELSKDKFSALVKEKARDAARSP